MNANIDVVPIESHVSAWWLSFSALGLFLTFEVVVKIHKQPMCMHHY